MEQNQLHLIKKLERKLKTQIRELEKNSHEPQNYKKKCDEMEERIGGLEREVKKILYAIGK
jgi:hypothetical protein